MKKIILTGSTGFIGSELLKELSKNYKIYITLRAKTKKITNNKNVVKIFFNNYEVLSKKLKKLKVNAVIHCATHYVKHHKFEDLKKLSDSNILFGNVLLENLEYMGVKKFINFSTVWENYDGKKDNNFNLYSVYKSNFTRIMNFYKKKLNNISFLNLTISDTFGGNDKRNKIINILKNNYKKNLQTKIISKNLYLNLLNVVDINNALILILKNKYKSGSYLLSNKNDFKIINIIKQLNKISEKKIKVKWLSDKVIKEKTYKYNILKNWKPLNSKIEDIINVITE